MYENFDELREAALACRNCKLAETRRNVVFGARQPRRQADVYRRGTR